MADPMFNPKLAAQKREEQLKKERIAKILGTHFTLWTSTHSIGKKVEDLTEADLAKYQKPTITSPTNSTTQTTPKYHFICELYHKLSQYVILSSLILLRNTPTSLSGSSPNGANKPRDLQSSSSSSPSTQRSTTPPSIEGEKMCSGFQPQTFKKLYCNECFKHKDEHSTNTPNSSNSNNSSKTSDSNNSDNKKEACEKFQPQTFKKLFCSECFLHKDDHIGKQASDFYSSNSAMKEVEPEPEPELVYYYSIFLFITFKIFIYYLQF
jgi:hypothetical protein